MALSASRFMAILNKEFIQMRRDRMTFAMMIATDFEFEPLLFESISAFATVGLSTGITGQLPPAGEVVLIVLMYVGRVGVVTVGAALALSHRRRRFTYPEERIIVG